MEQAASSSSRSEIGAVQRHAQGSRRHQLRLTLLPEHDAVRPSMGHNMQHVRLQSFELPAQFPKAAAAAQPNYLYAAALEGGQRRLQARPLSLGIYLAGWVFGDGGQDAQGQVCRQRACGAHIAQQIDNAYQGDGCTGRKYGAAIDIVESFPGECSDGRRRKAQPYTQPIDRAAFQVAAAAQPEVAHLLAPECGVQERPGLLQEGAAGRPGGCIEPGQPLHPIARMAIDGQFTLGAVTGIERMH